MKYLTVAQVLKIHVRQIEPFGVDVKVARDIGLN